MQEKPVALVTGANQGMGLQARASAVPGACTMAVDIVPVQ